MFSMGKTTEPWSRCGQQLYEIEILPIFETGGTADIDPAQLCRLLPFEPRAAVGKIAQEISLRDTNRMSNPLANVAHLVEKLVLSWTSGVWLNACVRRRRA